MGKPESPGRTADSGDKSVQKLRGNLKEGRRYDRRDGKITKAITLSLINDARFVEHDKNNKVIGAWDIKGISLNGNPDHDLVSKHKNPYNLHLQITNQLRKLFLFHPCQREVRQRNRLEVPRTLKNGKASFSVFYRCEGCKELFKSQETQVDHVTPVVSPTEGFVGWDSYISRMFCDSVGMRLVCKPCHQLKTEAERAIRTAANRARKLEEKAAS